MNKQKTPGMLYAILALFLLYIYSDCEFRLFWCENVTETCRALAVISE